MSWSSGIGKRAPPPPQINEEARLDQQYVNQVLGGIKHAFLIDGNGARYKTPAAVCRRHSGSFARRRSSANSIRRHLPPLRLGDLGSSVAGQDDPGTPESEHDEAPFKLARWGSFKAKLLRKADAPPAAAALPHVAIFNIIDSPRTSRGSDASDQPGAEKPPADNAIASFNLSSNNNNTNGPKRSNSTSSNSRVVQVAPPRVAFRAAATRQVQSLTNVWHTSSAMPVHHAVVSPDELRRGVVRDLVESERIYVKCLRELVEVYLKKLRRKAEQPGSLRANSFRMFRPPPTPHSIARDDVEQLLPLVEHLLQYHATTFLPELQRAAARLCRPLPLHRGGRVDEGDEGGEGEGGKGRRFAPGIAGPMKALGSRLRFTSKEPTDPGEHEAWAVDAIVRFFKSQEHALGVYVQYVQALPRAIALLSKHRGDATLQRVQQRAVLDSRGQGYDLASLLVMPAQRAARYHLFYRQLVKYSAPHLHPRLNLVHDVLQPVVAHINAYKRSSDNRVARVRLQRSLKLDFQFVLPSHTPPQQLEMSGTFGNDNKKHTVLLLSSPCELVVAQEAAGQRSVTHVPFAQVTTHASARTLTLTLPHKDGDGDKGDVVVLQMGSEDEVGEWCEAIAVVRNMQEAAKQMGGGAGDGGRSE